MVTLFVLVSWDVTVQPPPINMGMEHGAFNMAGLDEYMRGLIDGGPTNSGHRTPTVIVEAPVEATSEEIVRFNAWQFRQILARGVHGIVTVQTPSPLTNNVSAPPISREEYTYLPPRYRGGPGWGLNGVHGILLCQTESATAVRAFIEACRYPVNRIGVGDGPKERLGEGRRGVGSEPSAMPIWGVERDEYLQKADPWPLNSDGELLLGLKIESAAAIPHIEEILSVPGIGFAEMGAGDLNLSLGYKQRPVPLSPEMEEVRQRVRSACIKHGIAFLEGTAPDEVIAAIDSGARVLGGHREEAACIGRAHTGRTMPV